MNISAEVETRKHIQCVSKLLSMFAQELLNRGIEHDASKLQEPEASIFEQYTSRLSGMTYGSTEYYQCMKEMKPAIDHHQHTNRHHPEFHGSIEPIKYMDLFDLVEMFLDWQAATLRHADGDIGKSITHNKTRFNMSDQVEVILRNTAERIKGWTHAHT
jgi:hypothetical protein